MLLFVRNRFIFVWVFVCVFVLVLVWTGCSYGFEQQGWEHVWKQCFDTFLWLLWVLLSQTSTMSKKYNPNRACISTKKTGWCLGFHSGKLSNNEHSYSPYLIYNMCYITTYWLMQFCFTDSFSQRTRGTYVETRRLKVCASTWTSFCYNNFVYSRVHKYFEKDSTSIVSVCLFLYVRSAFILALKKDLTS